MAILGRAIWSLTFRSSSGLRPPPPEEDSLAGAAGRAQGKLGRTPYLGSRLKYTLTGLSSLSFSDRRSKLRREVGYP
jgi:hypothetical protein